jgi:uncharacterized protein YggE
MQDSGKSKLSISISWWMICVLLLATNAATLLLWRPWYKAAASTRKISVSGQATLKAVPDEYQLSPSFEFANADRAAATNELTKLSSDITAKLKALGVTEDQIATNTNAYDKYDYTQPAQPGGTNTLQLSYTITVGKKDLAQSVQDYMLTLKPKGQLSPQATFSQAKQKELEAQAREKSIDDAKQKALKTASQLGAKLGRVVTVSDGTSGGGCGYSGLCMGANLDAKTSIAPASASGSVAVQPGQNEYNYTVSVEYEIK